MSNTIEGSLWKLKSSMTGASWKKHWVSTDGTKVNQWHSRAKPSASDPPKYSLYLKDCNISDYQGRKYCFKIAEKNSNLALILAVDDFDSYEKWLKILITSESGAEQEQEEHAEFPLSVEEEEDHDGEHSATHSDEREAPVEEAAPDFILEFFRAHDVYENAANPCMPLRHLHDLLPQLDSALNLSVTIRLLLRDLNTGIHGVLSYADFVVWWEAHKSVEKKKPVDDGEEVGAGVGVFEPNTIVGINSSDAVHLVGFIDSTTHRDTLRSAFITHLRLPPSDSVFDHINTPVIDEVSDWNDAFQSSAERVDMLCEVFLTTTAVEQGVFEVENEEEKGSVDEQSDFGASGVHTHATHSTHNTQNTHHTTNTHTTHTTNNTHTNTHSTHTSYNTHPTQVSRSTNRTITGALPPALGGSRNTIAYPDVVSRDGYIVPVVPAPTQQARGGVVYSGDSVSGVSGSGGGGSVISQSLASHVYSKDSVKSDTSHTQHSQSRSVRSSIHSALSHASHLFHHTQNNKHQSNHNLHTLPPLPEGSYQSDETKSERSFDTRNTEEIHADSQNENDEYYNSNSVNGSDMGGSGGGFGGHSVNGDGNNGVKSAEEQWVELVEACVHVSAVKGAFYRTAIDGVRCIIDEYCLPDEMKTALKLSADLVDTEGFNALHSEQNGENRENVRDNMNSTATEVYAYSGMLFSIAACPASTADASVGGGSSGSSNVVNVGSGGVGRVGSSDSNDHHVAFADTHHTHTIHTHTTHTTHTKHSVLERQALTSASDEVQHKVAGNEVRNTDLLQATINLLYAQAQLTARINGTSGDNVDHVSSGNVNSGSNAAQTDDNNTIDTYNKPPLPTTTIPTTRPTTLLTTVVDYAGFRVTVLCPTLIDEHTTLVHGPSTVQIPTTNTNTNTITNTDTSTDSATNTLHVRASPEVPLLLSGLASNLNLHIYTRPRPVLHTRLHETDTNYADSTSNNTPLVRNIDILTTDIQVHDAPDGRMYVLNLKNLLPNALPRPSSYDVQTRQLRAEYVRSIDYALKCDILQQSMQFSLNGAAPHSIDVRAERVVIQEAGYNITACRELFSITLPHVASLLDQYTSLPLDSYGLTTFLHAHGVNCRHMGVLYWLCNSASVKSVILSEALARCVKTVLNAQLRANARRTKGGVLRAQHRGRSIQNDYTEFVDNANMTHRSTVLELFNLVLGWGPQSDKFWEATLLDALDQKFGIQASKAHLLTQLHLPQLFIAMQYHTGTRFQDNPVYNLNTTVVVNPFNTQHILEYFIPTTKVSIQLSGEIGQLYTHADVLLLNGLYAEAATALKLKLLLYTALFGDSSDSVSNNVRSTPYVYQSMLAHTVYKCALAYYLSAQYSSAYNVLRKYLARSVRYHAITGRILSLLMCVCFKSGHIDKAVQYFDAAQEVYTYTLGANHPILCMHTNTLAELYNSIHAYTHAHAMRLLAHVTAQKSLGDKHIITAMYECKLASVYIEQQNYVDALPYLENCIEIFALADGPNFAYESSVCLYNTAVCLSVLGDVDRAGQLALKCVDTARTVDHRKVNVYPMLVSCYTLLSDLALAKNQPHASVGLLEQLWGVLKCIPESFAQRRYIGDVMAVLSKRILCLLVAHMTFATRSLFDSVVSDWHKQQSSLTSTYSVYSVGSVSNMEENSISTGAPLPKEVVVDVWSRACSVVFKAMMETSPSEYFERVMQGIRENAVGAGGSGGEDPHSDDASVSSPTVILANARTITFAAQAAVMSQLVFNAQEGASHTFIHI